MSRNRDDSSDANQWKQDESPYRRRRNAEMKSVSKTRRKTRCLARVPPLHLASGSRGERANSYYEINSPIINSATVNCVVHTFMRTHIWAADILRFPK